LDETYERVLREIKKPNRDHARRLLQCLVVAIRPLRVEELAEVLAVDFEDGSEIPKLKPSWRWEDQEQALLTSCSSLITIVDTDGSRVVQFSHFSVKEFLTSARLATSSQDVSHYHIVLKPAHMIMAQSCLSILLQQDNRIEDKIVEKRSPLAEYAAEHWARHAQFEDVASRIQGMEYLFDPDKPYFSAWRQLHDIDSNSTDSVFYQFTSFSKSGENTPLYYAALCGFSNLVEELIVKYPEHVNAFGGYYRTPAAAALAGRHFELAQVLHRNGSPLDMRGISGKSLLHAAVHQGDFEMVRVLLDYGLNVNIRDNLGSTPLNFALEYRSKNIDPRVVRFLLDHGADPNILAQLQGGNTPLHRASRSGRIEIARLLVEHGANVEVQDDRGKTPLDVATKEQHDEIVKFLSEHRAR
jgi:Ankyrin repeats (3 copies)/Ankyrin repeats (many copies)